MAQQTPPPGSTGTSDTAAGTPGNGSTPGSTPPTADPGPGASGNRFFSWLRALGIQREPGWIGGVSAGLATRMRIDPVIVRGIIVVLTIVGAPTVLLYAAAWLLLPDQQGKIHLEQVLRGRFEAAIAGIGALVLLAIIPGTYGLGTFLTLDNYNGAFGWAQGFAHLIWLLAITASIVWFIVWLVRRAQAQPGGTAAGDGMPRAAATSTNPGDPAAGVAPFAPYVDPTTGAPVAAAPTVTPPPAPPAPTADSSAADVAAWREQQAQWKQQHDAYRRHQGAEFQAANRAAQERARQQRFAQREAERAARARTRSNPLYSFIVIGLAIVIGGIVTLATYTAPTAHTLDVDAILAGLASALAVLAVGIIVNGVRGKRSGGASGFAAVLLVPIIFAAIVPQTDTFRYAGDQTFTVVQPSAYSTTTYVNGAGAVRADLSKFYPSPAPAGTTSGDGGYTDDSVNIVVGAGDVTVTLPKNEWVSVVAYVGGGSINASNSADAVPSGTSTNGADDPADVPSGMSVERFGRKYSDLYHPPGQLDTATAARVLNVRVYVGTGSVTIIDPNKGVTP
ncbi:PspC domain-containing protein [Glaciihabitans sp. dw_435]|uniref:PspC domain-containing protein n=1 Tax=Glaciihabitans sp. dw_435 TaxID=2720081 RepID=UPI001BD2B0BB|nr:PspC domain-containing protein [Glaciihabitans sp. dw_435]